MHMRRRMEEQSEAWTGHNALQQRQYLQWGVGGGSEAGAGCHAVGRGGGVHRAVGCRPAEWPGPACVDPACFIRHDPRQQPCILPHAQQVKPNVANCLLWHLAAQTATCLLAAASEKRQACLDACVVCSSDAPASIISLVLINH